jgi:hypothetical protein
MSSSLREYIALIVEKVRSQTFDLNVFKSITDPIKSYAYARSHLKLIGKGSSRMVFEFNSKSVLKVAYNDAGLAQNKKEISVNSDPSASFAIARIHASDKNGLWVIVEAVRPINGMPEFSKLLGTDTNFYMFMQYARSGDLSELEGRALELATALVGLVKRHGLAWFDVDNEEHWGKTADGRVVLLDYGEELNEN